MWQGMHTQTQPGIDATAVISCSSCMCEEGRGGVLSLQHTQKNIPGSQPSKNVHTFLYVCVCCAHRLLVLMLLLLVVLLVCVYVCRCPTPKEAYPVWPPVLFSTLEKVCASRCGCGWVLWVACWLSFAVCVRAYGGGGRQDRGRERVAV